MEKPSKIWFSSDWHLFHNKEFIYKSRGFDTIEEMNNRIISNFNECVGEDDLVYLLGDLFLGDNSKIDETFNKLHGNINIVLGNHCTITRQIYYRVHCRNVLFADELRYHKWLFYLSHYPTLMGGNETWYKRKLVNLSGHTHSRDKFEMMDKGIYNVAVDAHDCYPVDIDTIIEDIEAYHS